MKRILKLLLAVFLIGIFLPFLWLFMTQSGLRWIVNKATAPYSSIIRYDNVGGALASGIKINKLRIDSAGYKVTLDNAELHTQFRKLIFGQLYVTSLKVSAITITPLASVANNAPSSSEPLNFNIVLPVSIFAKAINIDHLVMNTKKSYLPKSAQIVLKNMRIRNQVSIDSLTVSSAIGVVRLQGKLPLSTTGHLAVNLSTDIHTPLVKHPVIGSLTLTGNYNNILIRSTLSSPDTVSFRGEATNLLSSPHWNATLESPLLTLQHWTDSDDMVVSNLKINSVGQTDNYNIVAEGKFNSGSFKQIGFNITANQTNNIWSVKKLVLDNKQTDQSIDIYGTIYTTYTFNTTTQAQLKGQWKNLQWPLTDDNPNISSRQGAIEVSGSLSQYTLKARGDFSASTHHFDNINLSGTGNIEQIEFKKLSCDYLDGAWSGGVLVNWQNGIRWQSTLAVKHADINPLITSAKSSLSGNVSINGSVINSNLRLDSQIQILSGLINGYPINAKANIVYNNKQLTISHADVRSKNNHLNADFILNTASDSAFPVKQASWSINAKNLTELYPALSGKLVSKGVFSTDQKTNEVYGNLTADKLQFKDVAINQFSLNVDTTKDNKTALNATGKNINIGNYKVKEFHIDGEDLYNNPVFKLHANSENKGKLFLKTRLHYASSQWELKILNLTLSNTAVGNWALSAQPQTLFTKSGFSSEPICIQKQGSKDHLCLSPAAKDYQNIDISLALNQIGLDNFKTLLPPNILSVSGAVNGDAHAHYRNNTFTLSQLQLRSDKGLFDVSTSITAKNQFEYNSLEIQLSKANRFYTITSSTHIVDAGYFKSQITFSSAYINNGDWKNNKLSGYLDVQFENLDKLSLILPVIANAKGNWISHFTFSGTLSHPILIGESSLDITSVDLPASGITIKKLKVITKSDPDSMLIINGNAESGSGNLKLDGKLKDYSLDKFTGSMKISGDHFKIANLPEISAVVSPELNFTLSENQADLEGDLTINEADIKVLSQITSMTPSPDVVIVTKPKEEKSPYPNIDFISNVRVTLGDKVWLRGYGFEGRLNGSILVKQRPGELTKASGTINIVDGRYSAYGQSLQIESGVLNFAGNPIDNPSVKIRAIRKINDNIVVGLSISGQAQSPVIKLISEPAMEDADTLSYLIRGYPLKSATVKDGTILAQAAASIGLLGAEKLVKHYAKYFGIDEVKVQANNTTQEASLVLGKYLSPKLYMSYAIGVGQAINTLQLQYKLSEHWVIKTESGIGQAADILFTIEK